MRILSIRMNEDSPFNFDSPDKGEIPCPSNEPLLTYEQILLRRLQTYRQKLSALASLATEDINDESIVTSDDGQAGRDAGRAATTPPKWLFFPGEAAFGGTRFAIAGIPMQLLRALAESRRGMSANDMLDTIWGRDKTIGLTTLRSHISRLRNRLRTEFGLRSNVDPIPRIDHGQSLAWKLDDSVLK